VTSQNFLAVEFEGHRPHLQAVAYRMLARGRAIAARSVDALSAWAFGLIGFNRLNLHHSTANTASCWAAERTGYRLEGTLRQAIKHADGWHVHGRLRTDT
jgi:ribosomal-protein-alanine N-acetyltransferase